MTDGYKLNGFMADDAHLRRLRTGDVELGISDVLQRHITRHVADQKPITQRRLDFEHTRPRWYREIIAEAIGVFLYGMLVSCRALPRLVLIPIFSLPWYRIYRISDIQPGQFSRWIYFSDWLGIRDWHSIRHHCRRNHLRWALFTGE